MLFRKLAFSLIAIAFAFMIRPSVPLASADGGFTLTILHNNDAASQLIPVDVLQRIGAGEHVTVDDIENGVAEFKTLVDTEVSAATGPGREAIVLSGGNSMGAGPILEASNEPGSPEYDAIAMQLIGYDAAVLGARDFEDGPDELAAFLCGLVMQGGGFDHPACGKTGRSAFPMLAANLDFSGEPSLEEFAQTGGIAASTIVNKGGYRIGVIGITNPQLRVVSSPGNVGIDANVVRVAQAEADKLAAQGVNKVILIANLETADALRNLTTQTQGIDIVVTGASGGVPFDVDYPEHLIAKDGARVPVIVTPGGYQYLGKLVVSFDADGNITRTDPSSGLIALGDAARPDLRPDPIVQTAVERPVLRFLEQLAVKVVARTDVALDGRGPVVESQETNLGDLMADAVLWQASRERPGGRPLPTGRGDHQRGRPASGRHPATGRYHFAGDVSDRAVPDVPLGGGGRDGREPEEGDGERGFAAAGAGWPLRARVWDDGDL